MKLQTLRKTALASAITLSLLGFSNDSYAKYELNLNSMFSLIVFENSDGPVISGESLTATDTLDPLFIPSLKASFDYWENILKPYATNTQPVKSHFNYLFKCVCWFLL